MTAHQLKLTRLNSHKSSRFVVKLDGRDVGTVEKFHNTRTETHPWKAYLGVGEGVEFLGSFYGTRGLDTGLGEALDAMAARLAK